MRNGQRTADRVHFPHRRGQRRIEAAGLLPVPIQGVQQAEPRVTVERAGEPQVTVQRQGEPRVTTERQPGQNQATGTTATPAPAQSAAATQQAATTPTAAVPLARVSNLVGTNLVSAEGRNVGEIENLVVDGGGNVRGAVVEWGGFLGIGQRKAVVPIERIQLGASSEDRARLNMTREELEALPRYDRDNLGQYANQYGWGQGVRLHR